MLECAPNGIKNTILIILFVLAPELFNMQQRAGASETGESNEEVLN
jgi:hypothetical protein